MSTDPYKYFRIEARELLDELVPVVLRLEKCSDEEAPSLVDRVMRLSHTLKGAAGVVGLGGISRRAHAIEDILGIYLDKTAAPVSGDIEAILQLADEIDMQLDELSVESAASEAPNVSSPEALQKAAPEKEPAAFDERVESIRIDIEQMDALTAGLVQAGVEVVGLERDLASVERVDHLLAQLKVQMETSGRDDGYGLSAAQLRQRRLDLVDEARSTLSGTQRVLLDHIRRISRELTELRSDTTNLRLVPAAILEPMLERAVRDAAQVRDKQVDFRFSGGQVRLDASVLAGVREALLHLVRNAVAHGIEETKERQRADKPRGCVEVQVERLGDQVQITCSDDGAGVDAAAVAELAATKGVLSPEDAHSLSVDEAISLLLGTHTLTTSPEVDTVSGRGLGLSIASQAVAQLHGQISMQSQRGLGTEVKLTVPVSTAWMTVVRLAGDRLDVAIPLEAVVEVRTISANQLLGTPGRRTVDVDHDSVPFGLVDQLLGGRSRRDVSRATPSTVWTAVVIDSIAGRFVLGGARVVGTEDVVVRQLPGIAQADKFVSGAYLDANGQPKLVIEPTAAARALKATSQPAIEASTGPALAPLLVIDDSLTTRMLLQSILEASGFEVELAASAEEGLELARDRDYEIFLVDVEMPGISGFEFVELTRRDPRLRETPAILITSRNDPADRRRGLDAGASDYVVKGEFDQGRLLEILKQLSGRPSSSGRRGGRSG